MERKIEFEGQLYEVPDDATDDEISGILSALSSTAPLEAPEPTLQAEAPVGASPDSGIGPAPGLLMSQAAPLVKPLTRAVGKTVSAASVAPKIVAGSIGAGLGAAALAPAAGPMGLGAGITAGGAIGAKLGKKLSGPIRRAGEAIQTASTRSLYEAGVKRGQAAVKASKGAAPAGATAAFANMMSGKGAVISPQSSASAINAAKAAVKPSTLEQVALMFPKFTPAQRLLYAATRLGNKYVGKALPVVGNAMTAYGAVNDLAAMKERGESLRPLFMDEYIRRLDVEGGR